MPFQCMACGGGLNKCCQNHCQECGDEMTEYCRYELHSECLGGEENCNPSDVVFEFRSKQPYLTDVDCIKFVKEKNARKEGIMGDYYNYYVEVDHLYMTMPKDLVIVCGDRYDEFGTEIFDEEKQTAIADVWCLDCYTGTKLINRKQPSFKVQTVHTVVRKSINV